MSGRCVWRWLAPMFLLGVALLAVSSVPQHSLVAFFDHPAHPRRSGPPGVAPPADTTQEGATLLRVLAVVAAVGWVAGGALLAKLRSDTDESDSSERGGDDSGGESASGHAEAPIDRREFWGVVAITLIAILVRVPFLAQSLWFDEIAAFLDFTRHGPGPIMGAWFTPSNHILQSLLSWVSLQFVHPDDLAIRLPALVAGVLTVPAVFGLARQAGGSRLALIAAVLVTVMPIAVVESVEARGYSMVILLAAVSGWAWMRGLRRGSPWCWPVMALATALGIWSHFFFAWLTIGQAAVSLAMLLRSAPGSSVRRRAASALVGAALAILLAAVLLAPVIPDILAIRGQFSAHGADQPTLFSPEGSRIIFGLGGAWGAATPPLFAAGPGLLLAIIGAFAAARHVALRRAIAGMLAGLVVLVLIECVAGSWIYARFTLFAIPGALLLIAAGLEWLLAKRHALGAALAGLLAAAWLFELALLPPRQPLHDAVDFVLAHRTPVERIGMIGIQGNVLSVYAPQGVPIESSGVGGERLEAMLDRWKPAWIIVTYPGAVKPGRMELMQARGFRREATLPGWADWGKGEVQIWHLDGGASP